MLIVCPFYPPEKTIAAIRIGKFAEYWAAHGQEVTVLCREPVTNGLPVPKDPRIEVVCVRDPLGGASVRAARSVSTTGGSTLLQRALRRVKSILRQFAWPDFYGLWAIQALREAKGRMGPVDVVVASVGPFSAMLLGTRLARVFNAKLVLDYRDMLAFGTYYDHNWLRTWFDSRIERRLMRRAALIAGVSEPMVEEIAKHTASPTVTVTNGFEPEDFAEFRYVPSDDRLRIVYCGQLYLGRRDPRVLFEAIAQLSDTRPDLKIEVDFYGRGLESVLDLARRNGVSDRVRYHGEVSHEGSLRAQAQADLLLLLLWNHPGERAVLSGKLFEYMGAARPIVMLGLEDGAAAKIISDYELGIVSNDPKVLADYLEYSAQAKVREGTLAGPPPSDLVQFTRAAQSDAFLNALLALEDSNDHRNNND